MPGIGKKLLYVHESKYGLDARLPQHYRDYYKYVDTTYAIFGACPHFHCISWQAMEEEASGLDPH